MNTQGHETRRVRVMDIIPSIENIRSQAEQSATMSLATQSGPSNAPTGQRHCINYRNWQDSYFLDSSPISVKRQCPDYSDTTKPPLEVKCQC